jgi:hypothetical protein
MGFLPWKNIELPLAIGIEEQRRELCASGDSAGAKQFAEKLP